MHPAKRDPNIKYVPGFDNDCHWYDFHQAWIVQSAAACNLHQQHDQKETTSNHIMPSVLGYESDEE
jgi:hypothetical protein